MGSPSSNSNKVPSEVGPQMGTHRRSPTELKTQANRPQGNGTLRRGDRRDTHPLHSTGKNARAGGKPGASSRNTRKH